MPDPTLGAVTESTPIGLEVRPSSTYAIDTQLVRPGQLQFELRGIYAGRSDTIIVRASVASELAPSQIVIPSGGA